MHKHKDIGSVVTEFDRLEGKRLPGGTPHMKGVGMLVGNSKGDRSGRGPSFFDPY